MRYVTLGKTGLKVSRLGFGCMRFPMKDKEEVDREKTIPMLRRARELGVNYYDTAVMYCGGDSQRVLGEAFEDVREQIILSTKNHYYDKNDKDGWWQHLENSLERLRTDYIDVYRFHGLRWEKFKEAVDGEDGLYKEMLKAKEQGIVRHICCSFHDSCEALIKLIDTGMFESVLIQYNLLDRKLEDGIAHASEKGVGIEVMGPVGGGRLGYPSEKAMAMLDNVKSTPELALRFVLANEGVDVAFSGMTTMDELEENVRTVNTAGELGEEEFEKIDEAIEERKQLNGLYCTGCNYCMPCPEGVNIPENFNALNMERVFGLTSVAKKHYKELDGKAALCKKCQKCIERCPQNLDIPFWLDKVVETLDDDAESSRKDNQKQEAD
jgi:hypothetical protein